MEPRLAALNAVLDVLGVPARIQSVEDRKRIQKAVYLGQLAHVDLGYRYGWYLKGPYSPGLARDYYALDEALALSDADDRRIVTLPEDARASLERVRPLLSVPRGIALLQEDWLELVASLHFLRKVRRLAPDVALEILAKEKQHLVKHADGAQQALAGVGLL